MDNGQILGDALAFGVGITLNGERVDPRDFYLDPIGDAARKIGAVRSEGVVPGLWTVPGYPELTTNQMMTLAEALSPSPADPR